MFDFASSELIVLGAVALLVIPPKDLPKAMRVAGYWIGKVRGVATQFRSGFDTMVREAELQEMEKKWAAENERIMREHPPTATTMPMALSDEAGVIHGHGGVPDDGVPDDGGVDAPPVTVEPPVISKPLVFDEVEPRPGAQPASPPPAHP